MIRAVVIVMGGIGSVFDSDSILSLLLLAVIEGAIIAVVGVALVVDPFCRPGS